MTVGEWCEPIEIRVSRCDELRAATKVKLERIIHASGGQANRSRVHPQRENAVLVAHALLRVTAAQLTGCEISQLTLDRTCYGCGHPRHGKPRLECSECGGTYEVSISHSFGLAAVAFGGKRSVGIDVQVVRNVSLVTTLGGRVFAHRELDDLVSAPIRTSYLYWSRKEAVLKLQGVGLAGELAHVDVSHPPTVSLGGCQFAWVEDLAVAEPYVGSIAMLDQHRLNCETIDPETLASDAYVSEPA